MLESVNAVPKNSGTDEGSDRIDDLLTSALADQARERRMLVETVFGAKAALVKAEEELAEVRELINKRDAELADYVTSMVEERVKPPKSDDLLARIAAVEDGIISLAERLTHLPGQVRRDLEVSAVAVGERVGDEAESLLNDLREDQVEVVETLVEATDKSTQELRDSLDMTAKEIVEAYRSGAEAMVEHLTGFLIQRDEHLQRMRDQRLIELFMQLGDVLGAKNRRKLAKAISDEHGTTGPPPPPPPAPPVPRTFRAPAPPSRGPMPPPMPPGPPPGPAFRPPYPQGPPPPQQRPVQGPPPPHGPPGRENPPPFERRVPGPPASPGPGQPPPARAEHLTRDELAGYLADTPEEMFSVEEQGEAPGAGLGRFIDPPRRKPPADEPPRPREV